jgi:hypothetical protein
MNRITSILLLLCLAGSTAVNAQTEKDNLMVGSSIANLQATFQSGTSTVGLSINPKIGYFVRDNFALGAGLNIGLTGAAGVTTLNYGILPFARYYFTTGTFESKRTRFFGEVDLGVSGVNVFATGNNTSTNGLSFSAGPGMAYFITPNVGMETMLKLRGITGFGNSTFAFQPELNLGFQIYLPTARAKKIYREERRHMEQIRNDD